MKIIKCSLGCILVLALFSLIYFPVQNTFAAPDTNGIYLEMSPKSSFISMSNMAPGDIVSKVLTVKNSGNLDFNYFLTAQKESGDQLLFNQLKVKISKDNSILYSGLLAELNNKNIGKLTGSTYDNIQFTVELPKESGNEFQNKNITFMLKLVANGIDKSISNEGNLPDTGTNMFNLLGTGGLLVLLGLIIQLLIYRRKKNNETNSLHS